MNTKLFLAGLLAVVVVGCLVTFTLADRVEEYRKEETKYCEKKFHVVTESGKKLCKACCNSFQRKVDPKLSINLKCKCHERDWPYMQEIYDGSDFMLKYLKGRDAKKNKNKSHAIE